MKVLPISSETTQFRHLKMQVQRRLNACLRLAEAHFQQPFPMPVVDYDVRGMKAGVACLQQNTIKFNRTLLMENPEEFIRQVVPHELAHLIVYRLFGRVKPHGKEWQSVMTELFQVPADTCHQFDVQSVCGQTFDYRCQCGIHRLSIRRHNKIQREKIEYFCRKCKQKLYFSRQD